MGMFSAAKEHAPNATLCYLSSRIRALKNKVVDYLDGLQTEKRDKLIKLAITFGRKQRGIKRKRSAKIKEEISKRMAAKQQKKQTFNRNKVESKFKNSDVDVSREFPDLDEETKQGVQDILAGKVVGRRICHVWYDVDSQEKTLYNEKIKGTWRYEV